MYKENVEEVLLNVYTDTNNFSYNPLSAEIKAIPYLEIGDMIEIQEFKTTIFIKHNFTHEAILFRGIALCIESAPKTKRN